jgi:TonB-like protein
VGNQIRYRKMRTSNAIFSTPAPKPRLREFFANLRVLIGAAPRLQLHSKSRPTDVKYADIPRGRVPGRGLLYSFLAHEFAIFAILTVSTAMQLTRAYRHAQEIWRAPERNLTYMLPELGGGSSGEKPAPAKPAEKVPAGAKSEVETASSSPEKPAPPLAAPSKPGLVYPALQPIVSNPPNPTNHIQTIMQPELVNPPTLNVPLALPNMVMVARSADSRPLFAPKVSAPPPSPAKTPSAPELGPERHPLGWRFVNVSLNMPLPAPPQLSLPDVSSRKFTPLPQNPAVSVPKVTKAQTPATPEAEALKPEVAENLAPALPGVRERVTAVPKVSTPASSPSTPSAQSARLKPEFGGGTDAHSVLVLSPTPGPPTPISSIPAGEARGQFAMGPDPNLKATPGSGIGLGAPGGTGTATTGSSASESNGTPASSGSTARSEGAGGGTSPAAGGSGEGKTSGGDGGVGASKGSATGTGVGGGTGTSPSGTGFGAGIASGTAGSGKGLGPGTEKGKGSGAGVGTGSGPGTGAGTGPGTSPFSGITIAGGTSGSAAAGPAKTPITTHPLAQSQYGMNVVATASSGGGLRDYGIFRNETVFTVYIDQSQAQAPSWTLQYAEATTPAPDPMVSSLTLSSSGGAEKQITPPYPVNEEEPKFPSDVVARNPGRMVVISGVLSAEGKFTHLRIVQSPNPLLNAPALEALSQWTFRPAERAGQALALKILLGIPLPSASQ